MAWLECSVMDERVRLINCWLEGGDSISELSRRFGVSRKTVHKWISRYEASGPAGLYDGSSARLTQSRRTPHDITERIIRLRKKRPTWGPRKLRAKLILDEPGKPWPAASTIGGIINREGLVHPRKLRRRVPPMEEPFKDTVLPNDTWCMDFKGWWRTRDNTKFEAFTLTDAMSRYILTCKPVRRTGYEHVWPLLSKAVRNYGLPKAIRSDNGPPFATTSVGGLSRLGINFIKMGVTPERIEPGKPQQNGRHERMHLTLKIETATPPATTWAAQARALRKFQHDFNTERPHEALGQVPPSYVYRPSPRVWDGKFRSPGYLHADAIRKVRSDGTIKWKGRHLYIYQALYREPVGIFEVDNDIHEVKYGQILLGYINTNGRFVRKLRAKIPKNCNQRARSKV